MKICVFSPGIYTYGAMVIGGIIREAGYEVAITKNIAEIAGNFIFISLYSTHVITSYSIHYTKLYDKTQTFY